MPIRHRNPLVEGVEYGNTIGLIDEGEALLEGHQSRALHYLTDDVHDGKVTENAAADGQNILSVGLNPACRPHPQGRSNRKAVRYPRVQYVGVIPLQGFPVGAESEQGRRCREHREIKGVLLRQLEFRYQGEGKKDKVEITYLKLLHKKRL